MTVTQQQKDAFDSQVAHCKAINDAVKEDKDFENDPAHRSLAAFPDITNLDRIILVLTMSQDCDGEKFLCDWVWPLVENPNWLLGYRRGVTGQKQRNEGWWFPHMFPKFTVVVGKDANGYDIEQWTMPLIRDEDGSKQSGASTNSILAVPDADYDDAP